MKKRGQTAAITVIGSLILVIVLVFSTIWIGRRANSDTQKAVSAVSRLYLDELAGRREQVVEGNLQGKIDVIRVAIDLMTEEDLKDDDHLRAYQSRMKQLYRLDKFAFVDTEGLIYTSKGNETNIADYSFDHRTITAPEISIFNLRALNKQVIIAVPVNLKFKGKTLCVCFMAIDMDEMLTGVSMGPQDNSLTFCNIYTSDGIALSNTVLGGLAVEDNLIEALSHADFDSGFSYDMVKEDFSQGRGNIISFTYDGIRETLAYVPVDGTDWLLTYLIRESVITEDINPISDGILRRSIILALVTVAILLFMFTLIIVQTRRNAKLVLEKEKADAENRIKHEELERRLAMQALQEEQNRLITALSSDYWSVYYVDLDKGEGVCYQEHEDLDDSLKVGQRFNYLDSVVRYSDRYVMDEYKEAFLNFTKPENVKSMLGEQRVISYRYMVSRHGKETYEEVRFAGVRHPEDRNDHLVHAVGACFVDVDAETRKNMAQSLALKEALSAAEAANKAKTVFLSNMSHEIRTPMNAIIGLDNIALNDKSISEQTRDHLEKIGVSAHHLLSIINDILDMSRIESGRMVVKHEEFSLPKTLEQVNTIINGQCRDKGLNYECRASGKMDEYFIGDDMKLRQVLINILGNAVKFTPAGGTISFDIDELVRIDDKATLKFIIRDTGIGISKEFMPHIFDAFSQEDSSSTNRYGSTGMGMPITKSIVELMNGKIEVESEKGKGTTFTVTITLTRTHHKVQGEDEIDIKPHEMSVLVIDDDRIACEHAEIVLGQVGIRCETVLSGKEAIDMVSMRHARRDDYDLILVDWKMPDMDGIETTRQIRAIVGDGTPIIILTSYSWDDIIDEAKGAGVDTFVAKPLFAGNVLEQFREAFKRKNEKLVRRTADLVGRRILLAEDVVVNAEIMIMVLGMREMVVDHAENGKIAVDMFKSHEIGYYSAILMDMRMPEMDGLTATETIRGLDRPDAKTIPIIALTANAFDEDVQRSMQAGMNAHLSKPVEPAILFETLENLIKD
ncbi:MAG: response regulator [Spirochaetales bacterium]|nr:response regulator [Spirochaetales bacterium]